MTADYLSVRIDAKSKRRLKIAARSKNKTLSAMCEFLLKLALETEKRK